VRLAKRSYGWPEDAKFLVPDGVREHFHHGVGRRGRSLQEECGGGEAGTPQGNPALYFLEMVCGLDRVSHHDCSRRISVLCSRVPAVGGRDA